MSFARLYGLLAMSATPNWFDITARDARSLRSHAWRRGVEVRAIMHSGREEG